MMINPSRPWPQPLHSSKRFTGALCASLLGRLGLAGWVQQSSGMWGGGGSQVPQPWQVVTGRLEGTDRSQVVTYFWAPCTAPCVPCHKMYNTLLRHFFPPGEKKNQAAESMSRAKLVCLNHSVFTDNYSAKALRSLISENLCNKRWCGFQILAFHGVVPGNSGRP